MSTPMAGAVLEAFVCRLLLARRLDSVKARLDWVEPEPAPVAVEDWRGL